jgi:hypothetical protein
LPAYKGQPNAACTVCSHVERVRIELLVAGGGASHRALARKYGLSRHAVDRHWANHVSPERRAALAIGPLEREALASRVAEESESVLDHFKVARSTIYSLLLKAQEAGDGQVGALLLGRLNENLNSIARLTGELSNSPLIQHNTVNNFGDSAEYLRLKAALQQFGREHPAVMAALCEMLDRLEEPVPSPLPALEHQTQPKQHVNVP